MKNVHKLAAPFQEITRMVNGAPTEFTNHRGLTKREHFAAMAMQGLLSANAIYGGKTNDRDALAKDAVAFADAVLKELSK